MARDVLLLGGVAFDDFSTPEHMPFGGEQAMTIHKLPGGRRVIDKLGPDDNDIHWRGRLWGSSAYQTALLLDAMRRSGKTLPLSFGGQAHLVVISEFHARIERFPVDVLYEITCVITTPETGSGILDGLALAASDLGAALAL